MTKSEEEYLNMLKGVETLTNELKGDDYENILIVEMTPKELKEYQQFDNVGYIEETAEFACYLAEGKTAFIQCDGITYSGVNEFYLNEFLKHDFDRLRRTVKGEN